MKRVPYVKLSIAIIVIFALIRLVFAATHTISGDACWHLSAARFIATESSIPLFEGIGRLEPFWAPPLFHFVAAFFYKIFLPIDIDLADLGMKLISPIFGTLTVILLFLISRKFFDEKIAFYSMIFINFVPIFMDYSVLSYVESINAFFSVLSVYLILNKRYFFASLALGFALLSKYHAVFMYPMIIYLVYTINKKYNKKELYKKIAIVSIIPVLISSVWFLRNFILLGNPIWPFFNGIFHGNMKGTLFEEISFAPIFSLDSYIRGYLEFFGIPNGSLDLVISYATPFIKSLFWFWVIGTVIFIYPFLKGLCKKSNKNSNFLSSINVLLVSYVLMFLIFLLVVGWFGSRLLLPIVPFMAIIWAIGLDSIKAKKNFLIFIMLFIGIGFLIATGIKFATATNEWNVYSKDFEWAKLNTEKGAVFFGNGQCLSYNINRLVINHKDELDFNKVNYIWVNNKWKIDFPMNDETFNKIKNNNKLKIAYNNDNSGTVIYKVTQ